MWRIVRLSHRFVMNFIVLICILFSIAALAVGHSDPCHELEGTYHFFSWECECTAKTQDAVITATTIVNECGQAGTITAKTKKAMTVDWGGGSVGVGELNEKGNVLSWSNPSDPNCEWHRTCAIVG